MQRRIGRPASKLEGLILAGALGPAALLLAGCGSGPDLVSNVALPAEQSAATTPGFTGGADVPAKTAPLQFTDGQREYLDALTAAGVQSSNELRALSIGSSVCQARAAGQSEQNVWDYVAPMVRSDVADSHVSTQSPPGVDTEATVATYIRVATQWLC